MTASALHRFAPLSAGASEVWTLSGHALWGVSSLDLPGRFSGPAPWGILFRFDRPKKPARVLAIDPSCVSASLHRPPPSRAWQPPDTLTQARMGDSMESKIDRNRSTKADFVRDLKPKLGEMVRDHEARMDRMPSYEVVGRAIGRSGSWVRRLLGDQEVGLPVEIYHRAVAAYEAHCARIGARAAQKMRRAEQWRKETDALRLGSSQGLGLDDHRGLGAVAAGSSEAPA